MLNSDVVTSREVRIFLCASFVSLPVISQSIHLLNFIVKQSVEILQIFFVNRVKKLMLPGMVFPVNSEKPFRLDMGIP